MVTTKVIPPIALLVSGLVIAPMMSTEPGRLGAALVLLGAGIVVAILAMKVDDFAPTHLDIAVMALFAWLAAAVVTQPVPWISVYQFWVVSMFALGYTATRLLPAITLPRVAATIVTIGALFALSSIFKHVATGSPELMFSVRNNQAAFLGAVMMVALGLIVEFRSHPVQSIRGGTLLVSAILLSTAMAMTGSRAALLAAFVAVVMCSVGFALAQRSRLAIATPPLIFAAGFGLANLLTQGITLVRAATLTDPIAIGGSRLRLWENAFPLLLQDPFFGVGLGTTYFHLAAARAAADRTAGQHLHNDYLQYALEAGWAAGFLWLTVAVVAFFTLLRTLQNHSQPHSGHMLAIGAFAGAAVIMMHSAVDISLQVPVLLYLCGILFGICGSHISPAFRIRVPKQATKWIAVLIAMLVLPKGLLYIGYGALMPGSFTGDDPSGISGKLERIRWAIHLEPSSDDARSVYADLLRQAASVRKTDPLFRTQVYVEATHHADKAVAANPMSFDALHRRARLFLEYGEVPGNIDRAEADLRRALEIEPRQTAVRLALMQLLIADGQRNEALSMGVTGLKYPYVPIPVYLDYLDIVIELARDLEVSEALRAASERCESIVRDCTSDAD